MIVHSSCRIGSWNLQVILSGGMVGDVSRLAGLRGWGGEAVVAAG